jgi:glycosyltransferase involved in cell wall biosynthesis
MGQGISRRIKVLIIITRLIRGGAQREVLELLTHLDRNSYSVAVASHPGGEWVPQAAAAADAFHSVPELTRPISPLSDLAAAVRLFRLMRCERFDIVHTHTSKAGILGRLAARAAGVPVVAHTPHGTVFHDSVLSPRAQRVVERMERVAARWADCIVTKSACETDDYVRRRIAPRDKFRMIYSGLDLARLDLRRAAPREVLDSLGISHQRQVVLYAARFVPEKNHQGFLEAFDLVLDSMPETVALLAGEGPLRAEVERRASALIARGSLLSLGFRDDLPDLMRAADLCISASLTEGLPLMVAEALALGRCVVATDAGGTREVVRHEETGLLVPCDNPRRLADGIIRLLGRPADAARMGEEGRKHVRAVFDGRQMIRQTEQLYQECLVRSR